MALLALKTNWKLVRLQRGCSPVLSMLIMSSSSVKMANNYRALLLDIEGTTTSISFVKDTLFPFVRQELSSFLAANWGTPELNEVVNSLIDQNEDDVRDGLTDHRLSERRLTSDDDSTEVGSKSWQASLMANVLWQMDNDRKTGALKRLQGLIFRDAYAQGHLKGHVYDDVEPAFKAWTEAGKRIYIYSSGSVQAQKLLFGHSTHGNLCSYLSGYFDTTVGPKVESASYAKISAELIKMPADEILFVTDIAKEAAAASEAGLQVRLSVRPGNGELTDADVTAFGTINSLQELIN